MSDCNKSSSFIEKKIANNTISSAKKTLHSFITHFLQRKQFWRQNAEDVKQGIPLKTIVVNKISF